MEVKMDDVINMLIRKLEFFRTNQGKVKRMDVTETRDYLSFKIELGEYA